MTALYPQRFRMRAGLAPLCVAVALIAFSVEAAAAYPDRPIRFVVPYSPGGPSDALARLVGNGLANNLGQPVVIDVRPGASTIIGTEIVAKAPADGYTILTVSTTHTINPAFYKKLPYDTLKDFTPVTMMASTPFMLCLNPTVPANSVAELISLAKSKPGALAFASGGSAGSQRLTAELFNGLARIKMVHVPYKGAGPAFIDLVSGQVQVMFSSSVSSLPYVRSGRVRALAVTGLKRTGAAPDIPTVAESGFPGFESLSWFGVLSRAGTPSVIVLRLQQEIAVILKTPEVAETLVGLGADAGGMPSADFGKYFRDEMTKWGKVVRDAGIRPE